MINLTIEPLNHFFLRKGMSQKYKLLYYLKGVYVGGFSHWSEQTLQTGLLKMHIHSIVCTLSGKILIFICSKCTLN